MATATATNLPGDGLPTPLPPAEINPHAAAILADLRTPLVANKHSLAWITENICSISEGKTPLWWWIAFVPCALLAAVCFSCFGYLIFTGVGVWGENVPAAWAWDITNFVFWIGIGHAGTLISAILFLTRQKWRTAVNRAAEAMTLFAVVCAGLYPRPARGARLDGLVPRSGAQPVRHLAELPFAAALGRVRRLDVFHRVRAVLGSRA